MIIEVAGAPGSGKTTLLPAVLQTCGSAGLRAYSVEEAARAFARRTAVGRAVALLPPGPARRALWAVYYVTSMVAAVRLAVSRPELARYVWRTQRVRPAAADAAHRRVLYWYVRNAGTFAFLRAKGRPGEVVVIDEGFVHRAIQLHASGVECPTAEQIATYVDLVPSADLLVAVHADRDRCRERVVARGVWSRLSHRRRDEIDRFVGNAHRAIELAVEAARGDGRPIVDVDNDVDLGTAGRELQRGLEEALGMRRDPGEGRRRRPPLHLPRPTRLANGIRAWTRPPAIDPSVCEAVLDQYGIRLTGRLENVPSGARNRNVVVHTTAGKKVLRQYRQTARASTVRYEHSVLQELERRAFPAVRVTPTAGGDTIAHHGGNLYALFEFTEGANRASCVMSVAGRLRLLDVAGRTLARMHGVLADFAPRGQHHLGFRTTTGSPVADLEWHLEMLAGMSRDPGPSGGGREHHLALGDKRQDIAGRLVVLNETLAEASLPRAIIHGDYGVHNLLFRGDGSAVVHDFELARREWRLVDLVIVMSRNPANGGGVFGGAPVRAFLDGYRREGDLPAGEWRHLPEVWEYYYLTGAVRSWHNYFAHGNERRLATAVSRVREAERVREEAERVGTPC